MADITQTTETILKMNGQQASETMQGLRKRADELRQSIAKAMAEGDTKGAKQLQRTLNGVNREIKAIQASSVMVEHTLKNLDKAAPNDLKKTLQVLERQLQGMDRGSAIWKKQIEDIKRVKAELKVVNDELAVHETFMQRLNRTFNNWGQSIMAAAASITGIVMAGKKAVQMYAEMDQEMANVRKYTGMTSEQVEHLNEAFKQMDTRSSRDQLNKLAQEAGRLGMSSEEDVLGFVKAADKINVALDELGEGATLTLSKLTDIFGDKQRLGVEKSLLSVGSVINELSQNSTASASYLATFAQRMAGVGAQAKMTVPQIMGFGAVLDSQGQQVEMSASALSKLIMNLFKNADKIASATGLDLKKFKETAAKDTNEALIMLLERLHELGNMDALAPMFKEMGENGVRSSQVLAALAGNIDLVKQQQEAANVAFEEGISVDKEFEVQNTTVQAKLEKARKGFQEMAVTLGQELMPIVSHLISGTSATMRVLLKTIQFIKEYKGAIVTLTAAVSAYYAVVKAKEAWSAFVNGCKSAIQAVKAFNAALMANPYAAIAAAIVGIGTALGMYIAKRRDALSIERQTADFEKSVNSEYAKQAAKVKTLSEVVHNSNLAYSERKKALDELRAIVPQYNAELTKEGELINDNKIALDGYLDSLRRSIRIKSAQEKIEGAMTQQLELEPQLEAAQNKLDGIQKKIDDAWKEYNDANAYQRSGILQYINSLQQTLPAAERSVSKLRGEYDALQVVIDSFSKDLSSTQGTGGATTTETSTTTTTDSSTGGGTDTPAKNRFQAEEEWRAMEEAKARIAYAKGESDYKTYTDAMQQILVNFYAKELQHTDLSERERLEIEASYQEALKKQRDTAAQGTIEQENERYQQEKASLQQQYADGQLSTSAYHQALEMSELEHLQKMVNLYEEGSAERLKAQERYNQASLRYQEKHAADMKKFEDDLKKSRWSAANRADSPVYAEQRMALDAMYQELQAKATTDEQKLELDRNYYTARYALAKEFGDTIEMETLNHSQAVSDKIVGFLNSEGGQAITQSFSTIVNGMGQIFSGLSDIIDAEVSIQTAEIEKKYDAEIEAAGKNEKLVAQLEKKKQDEIAAVKSEASKKQFAMEVIQAVAQTAMSAIAAYSSAAAIPVVGYVMGPIAAAMALAAGGIQIAAIKKQQQAAEATGYAKGRKGGKAEFALIGEKGPEMMYIPDGASIVPNNKLQSPQDWGQYGVPTAFSPLDEVRRTNTIGTLGRRDVSRSITAQQVIAETTAGGSLQAGVAAQVASNSETAKTLERLNKRLDEPLVAVTTITGDKGIKRAQDRYEQLQRNVKSKKR